MHKFNPVAKRLSDAAFRPKRTKNAKKAYNRQQWKKDLA
jgi:hypothetical protein